MTRPIVGEKTLAMLGFDEHRQHRKMLAGVYTPANIRKLAPVFMAKTKETHRLFDRAIASHSGKTGAIDCTHTYSSATLHAVEIAIFGMSLAHTKNSARRYMRITTSLSMITGTYLLWSPLANFFHFSINSYQSGGYHLKPLASPCSPSNG
jgi:cytochrome P450